MAMSRRLLPFSIRAALYGACGFLLGIAAAATLRALVAASPACLVADLGTPGHRAVILCGRRADLVAVRPRVSPAFGRVRLEVRPPPRPGR